MKVVPDIKVVVPSDNLSSRGTRVYVFGHELEAVASVEVGHHLDPDGDGPVRTIVRLELIGHRAIVEAENGTATEKATDDGPFPLFWPFNWPGAVR